MIEPRCNLLSGPLDGKLVRVDRDVSVYYAAKEAPMMSFDPPTREDMLRRVERTEYIRTGPRTFIHESEKF